MISEAEAKAIAIADGPFDEMHVNGFSIALVGEEYRMSFEGANETGLYKCRYVIDAASGEILEAEKDPV